MFVSQLKLAVENKVPVKSCFRVSTAVAIATIPKGFPFIVKLQINKACYSNQAAECDWYRLA